MTLTSRDLNYQVYNESKFGVQERQIFFLDNFKRGYNHQPLLSNSDAKIISGTDSSSSYSQSNAVTPSPFTPTSVLPDIQNIQIVKGINFEYCEYKIVLSIMISSQFGLLYDNKQLCDLYLDKANDLLNELFNEILFEKREEPVIISLSILCFYNDTNCQCILHNLIFRPSFDDVYSKFYPIIEDSLKTLFNSLIQNKECILYIIVIIII